MKNINVDLSVVLGEVKPLHAVNNGPVCAFNENDQDISNADAFAEAGIPYARNHDAAHCSSYGGEHIVDVHSIFPNFDNDVNDPDSYDFKMTDFYVKNTHSADTKTFYRLGSKIEPFPVKYGTLVPKDFRKWAEICEHIILHYTQGWADGFHYDMEYWEIWNEPDLAADDAPIEKKFCWSGTKQQFFEFFEVAIRYLKEKFPELKIGGPAVASCINPWAVSFIEYCSKNKIPLDFFSWHCYHNNPKFVGECIESGRKLLDDNGYNKTQSILNEWNYVDGWGGKFWLSSLKTEKSLKGASYTAAVMCESMYKPLDMLMYYDARPGAMNGLFDTDIVSEKLKGYYPFWMFNKLYKLNSKVQCVTDDEDIYACAARNDKKAAIMLTFFNNKETKEHKQVKLSVKNICCLLDKSVSVKFYLLNDEKNAEFIKEIQINDTATNIELDMEMYSVYLITVEQKII